MKQFIPLCLAILTPAMAFSQVIVDDSWADGGRNNGADALDTDWWYSTSSSAIEVGTGFLGLVTGTSGRGIHGTFTAQSLNVGDSLTATFSFTTPATVTGTGTSTSFRAGFFDTTGKPGLAADITASSGTPNPIYNNLSGYMMDWDVNTVDANINFRERSSPTSGQLMAATGDYTSLSGGGDVYSIAANTAYTGVLSVTRTASDTLELTGSLFQGLTLLSTHTATDSSGITSTFGMLAFHANSSTFGSSGAVNTPDNGIDFTNIQIEYTAVPEPSTFGLIAFGVGAVAFGMRRMRKQ